MGPQWPIEWQSRYLFGDFVLSSLRWIEVNGSNVVTANGSFSPIDNPVDFALGPDGAVYVVNVGGSVLKVAYRPVLTGLTSLNIYGGLNGTATVTLDVAAPAAGLSVALSSSNTSVLTVPATMTVPAGATSGAFTFGTVPVAANQNSIVTATANGSVRTRTIYVLPAKLSTFVLSPA